ncbi:MAG: hypothetical protein QM733_05475 [Ilumatobacteraceae bacterium]
MAAMYGADADELVRIAAEFDRTATELDGEGGTLTRFLNGIQWLGDVATSYLHQWTGVSIPRLNASTSFLREAANQLRANSAQQRAVSNANGTRGQGTGVWVHAGRTATPGAPRRGGLFASGGFFDLSHLSMTGGGGGSNLGIDRFLNGPGGSRGPTMSYDQTWNGPSADVAAWRFSREGSRQVGDIALAGSVSVAVLAARAATSANLHVGLDGVNAGVGASAGAYYFDAKAQGSATYGAATLAGSARVMEGAEASASASVGIGKEGLSAKARAGGVAGLQASADGSIDVGGVGVGGRATGIVGVAANASAEASVSLTQVKAHVEIAAALGIGGGVSFDVNVEPKKILKEISSWHLF